MSRHKKLVKLLKRLIKQEHLYSPEKVREMKQELRLIEKQISELEAQTSKGFGRNETY